MIFLLIDITICNNVYATVKESEILTSHKICGGSERIAHAYTSVTDTVELRMFQKNRDEGPDDEDFYYVIRYDSKTFIEPKNYNITFRTFALII